jgi:hypothetical protein
MLPRNVNCQISLFGGTISFMSEHAMPEISEYNLRGLTKQGEIPGHRTSNVPFLFELCINDGNPQVSKTDRSTLAGV